MPFILYTILLSVFSQLHPMPAVQRQAQIELRFSNFAGDKIISPDSTYINSFGETYSIQRLKYYITNIELLNTKAGKRYAVPESYFLVDESDDQSKTITVAAPSGDYDAVSFLLGVDSLHNVSGAQT